MAACAAAAVAAVAMFDRRETRDVVMVWAGVIALVLVGVRSAPAGLVFAVAVPIAASFASDRRVRIGLLAAGLTAVMLVLTEDIGWRLQLGALGSAGCAGPLLWLCHRRFGHAVAITLMGGTAIGIYINVPDTEQIAVLASGLSVLAAAMMAFSPLRKTIVRFESLALVGALVMGAGAVGARGRTEAFIGVLGALGVLVAEPVAALVRRGTRAFTVVLIGLHAAVVLVVSRIDDLDLAQSDLTVVAGALTAAVVALIVLPRRRLQ